MVPSQLEDGQGYLPSCPCFPSMSCGGPLGKPSLSPGQGEGRGCYLCLLTLALSQSVMSSGAQCT